MVKSSIWNNQRLAPFYLSSSQLPQKRFQTILNEFMPHLTRLCETASPRDQRLHLQIGRKCIISSSATNILVESDRLLTKRAHGLARVCGGTVPDVFFAYDLNGRFGTRTLYVCNIGVGCCYKPFRCWEGSPARAMMMGS